MNRLLVIVCLVVCLGVLPPTAIGQGDISTVSSSNNGTFVMAMSDLPITLDPLSIWTTSDLVMIFQLGATLVAKDPATDEFVPYLAESWSVSDNGLTWEFKLREDVVFHDGTPLTAEEYAWTFNRTVMSAAETSSVSSTLLINVAQAGAVDTYTLHLDMRAPDAVLLDNLTSAYMQPLLPAAVEAGVYERGFVGVGPFRLQSWQPGEKLVLERNPDFAWGPTFTGGGPATIEQIEYVLVPDYDLAQLRLFDGQVDMLKVEAVDAERVDLAEGIDLVRIPLSGNNPFLFLNVSRPPFDDVRVRQAFNLAVNREQLVEVIEYGYGEPQYGPMSPSTAGYWPGAEEIGYRYDPEKAKGLLREAGYELNEAGVFARNGEPLSVTLLAPTTDETLRFQTLAQLLKQQYQELGAQVQETFVPGREIVIKSADYDMVMYGITWQNAFLLMATVHSRGTFNRGQINDPEVDALLVKSMTAIDAETSFQWISEVQKRIIEQAYLVPLYTPDELYGISDNVQDVVWIADTGLMWLIDASIDRQEN